MGAQKMAVQQAVGSPVPLGDVDKDSDKPSHLQEPTYVLETTVQLEPLAIAAYDSRTVGDRGAPGKQCAPACAHKEHVQHHKNGGRAGLPTAGCACGKVDQDRPAVASVKGKRKGTSRTVCVNDGLVYPWLYLA